MELLALAHPLARLRPVAEDVALQLDVVAVGVLVVVGERHPVVEADVGRDPRLAQAQIAGVQLLEAVVLKRAVVHPGAGVLLRVIHEPLEGEQRDAVVGLIVGQPCPVGCLEEDLGSNERAVPVDHLLQARRLQVEMVELGLDHGGVGHRLASCWWSGQLAAAASWTATGRARIWLNAPASSATGSWDAPMLRHATKRSGRTRIAPSALISRQRNQLQRGSNMSPSRCPMRTVSTGRPCSPASSRAA